MIAYRVKHNLSDIPFTTDSDFGYLLGPEYICIRKVEKKRAKDEDHNVLCEIVGYSNFLLEKVQEHIRRVSVVWKTVDKPVFDYDFPMIRALAAIAIGCDYWKGIPQHGYARMYELMVKVIDEKKTWTENTKMLMSAMIEKNNRQQNTPKLTQDILLTLCNAMLCEPATLEGTSINTDYIHFVPNVLPKILHYFKSPTTQLVDGPKYRTCNGIFGYSEPHSYIDAEPTYICDECGSSFCRTCGFVKSNLTPANQKAFYHKEKKEHMCVMCYRTCSIDESASKITITEMRSELSKRLLK